MAPNPVFGLKYRAVEYDPAWEIIRGKESSQAWDADMPGYFAHAALGGDMDSLWFIDYSLERAERDSRADDGRILREWLPLYRGTLRMVCPQLR